MRNWLIRTFIKGYEKIEAFQFQGSLRETFGESRHCLQRLFVPR